MLIEAKIIEVVLEDEYVLGIDWHLVFNHSRSKPLSYTSNSIGGIDIPSTSGPLAGIEQSDLAMFTINSTEDDFNAVISAIEAMGKANTLSNPRVTVLNNEEASIAVATRQPFVSQTVVQGDNTSTTADNVEFVDVGVTLSVIPTITKDNYILMEVKPEVSTAGTPLTLTSTDSQGEQFTRTVVPVVTSQEVETKVLVNSGRTLVLGGLIQDSQSVTQKKVPVLGDIPLIGSAFRSKSDDFKKTELVVFITPYILSPDKSSSESVRYFDADNKLLPFNQVGGKNNEYYDSSYTSQSYLHTDDNAFWEEASEPYSKFDNIIPGWSPGDKRDKNRNSYELDRELELQRTMNDLNQSDAAPRAAARRTAPPASTGFGAGVPVSAPSVPADAYLRRLKKNVFDAIMNEPALEDMSGEVKIDLTVGGSGYLSRLKARSLENPALNNLLILAINNNAPYAPLPADVDSDEQDLSFSLFF